MSSATSASTPSGTDAVAKAPSVQARHAGFLRDLWSVALRALRQIPREPEAIIPALVIPVFFFVVNVGALKDVAERSGVPDFLAFQLPVAIVFAVTGVSRASALVTDITSGYFDRLLMTPMSRTALLLGLMVSDLGLVIALSIPVLALGLIVGVDIQTGVLGALAFLGLAGLWGVAFTGFPYAIALRTGNPAAVNSSFLLFFPFAFLTTAFLPQEALTGWLAAVADYNPVTYLLAALRALLSDGWDWSTIGQGLLASLPCAIFSLYDSIMAGDDRVTDKQIQEWADQAEAGYDVEELKRRGRGRPGRGAEPMQVIAVRLTAEEIAALDAYAAREHLSRSEAIRRALAGYAA